MYISANSFQLTTAEILYLMPDYPSIIQSFIWQTIDTAPEFPKLQRFLAFWEKNLDGPIHSVRIVGHDLMDSNHRCDVVSAFVLH